MKKIALILILLFLTLSLSCFAQGAQDSGKQGNDALAEVSAINGKLEVQRENVKEWTPASIKMFGYIYDQFKTDSSSVADLEFFIGGHVGINKNTVIEIVGTREVKDVAKKSALQKIVIKTGAIWAKFKGQNQDLKFQTKGGVLAIKGTEFIIEEKQDSKETEISVLEGEVAYTAPSGQISAKAGDKITIAWEKVPVVHHYNPEELRKECENKYAELYNAIKDILRFVSIAQAVTGHSVAGSESLGYAYMAAEVINDPNEAVKKYAVQEVSKHVPGPFGSVIGSIASQPKEKKKPDFPSNLSPNQSVVTGLNPSFSWEAFEGADSYWIFVSPDEQMKELYWAQQIYGTGAEYPAWASKLQNGVKYYWRLIASKGDKPLGKASQTYFTVETE